MTETEPHDGGETTGNTPTRSGFVALIGPTNAGKSTLVNRFVGAKVSIVSHKVQTTRAVMRGIAIHNNAQIVFMDTPGIFKPRRKLDRAMVTSAWGGAKDADQILLLIDSERGLRGDAEAILEALKDVPQPKILVLNKIDRVKHEDLFKLAQTANEAVKFERTFMISATTGSGCDDVMDYLAAALPEGPWYYPRTRSPICRCVSSPPRSHAKSYSCACIRSCPILRMSRRRNGKSARTARFASSR